MTGVFYRGTAAGYLEFGRKEILKCGFMGMTLINDSARIQRRLNKAAAQDRTRRILTQIRKGGIA